IGEGKRAVELDPLSLVINTDLGSDYYYARRYDEAIAQLRRTLPIYPGFYIAHLVLGQVLDAKGARDAAIVECQKARALNDDPSVLGVLGRAYGLSRNEMEAEKLLDQLKKLSQERYVSAYSFALLHLGLRDNAEARRGLAHSYPDRAGWALSQGIAQVVPVCDIPNWIIRLIVLLIILGLPIALVLAWTFELTLQGIKRTEAADAMPETARQKKHTWIYVVVIAGAISI